MGIYIYLIQDAEIQPKENNLSISHGYDNVRNADNLAM